MSTDQPTPDDDVVILTKDEVSTIRAEASEDAGLPGPEVVIERRDGQPGYTELMRSAVVAADDEPEVGQRPAAGPPVHELVIADLNTRVERRRARHGYENSDLLAATYDRLLDAVCDLRQQLAERETPVS